MIDQEAFLVEPGQLAFLPKGKKRTYTQMSPNFRMYEMGFFAAAGEENLMERLGMTQGDYVVEIHQREAMSRWFEDSCRVEMFRDPIYDVSWCANVLSIIEGYVRSRRAIPHRERELFQPVLDHMQTTLDQTVTTEELARLVPMQPTYFIRRFKAVFGHTPQEYRSRLRLFRAMRWLHSTDWSVEKVARSIGMEDASYFSRFFKKYCKITPREYRLLFHKSTSGGSSEENFSDSPVQPKVDK
jgi:AraC-like DNA-binding protein